jgi:hypothetical protein
MEKFPASTVEVVTKTFQVSYGVGTECITFKVFRIRCSRCGRFLGEYIGEPFWIEGISGGEAKILCMKCRGEK